MRLVQISDVHCGDADGRLLAAAQNAIVKLEPDVIVLSGDVTQAGRVREYQEAQAFLADMPAPIVAAPGNHDAPVYNFWTRTIDPYGRFHKLPIQQHWAAENGLVRIAAITTARAFQMRLDWSQGAYSLPKLTKALEWGEQAQWRVLVAHHPPGTLAGARVMSAARRGPQARAMIEAWPRTLLLCGHSHGFTMEPLAAESSAILVAPSLASGRPRTGAHGFLAIDFDQSSSRITAFFTASSGFEPALELML